MKEITPVQPKVVTVDNRTFEYGPSDVKSEVVTESLDRGVTDQIKVTYVDTPAGRAVLSRVNVSSW